MSRRRDWDDAPVSARRVRKGAAPRGTSVWQQIQWALLGAAVIASIVVIVLCRTRYEVAMGALPGVFGFGLIIVAIVLAVVALNSEPPTDRDAMAGVTGGAAGLGATVFVKMAANCRRWPQPVLMFLLGVGTMIASVAGQSPPQPGTPPVVAGTGPAPAPPVPGQQPPKAEPPPAFVKAKTPPAANTFDGLLAYWPLDEGSGDRAFDTRNRLEATATGGQWVDGIRGKALLFNGTSDFLDLGDRPDLNLPANEAFTLACWVAPESKTGTVFWFRSHPDGLAILGVQVIDGKLRAWARQDGGIFHPHTRKGELLGPTPLEEGEWHHVAMTRRANGEIELYQDGRSIGRTKGDDTGGKFTTNARALGADAHAWRKSPRHPELVPLKGAVDEFCAFSRALSADEIAKLAGREP